MCPTASGLLCICLARRWRLSAGRYCSTSTPEDWPPSKVSLTKSALPFACGTPKPGSKRGWISRRSGAPVDIAVEAYRKALEFNPEAAGALVNLGTICYRQRKFVEAETYYRDAVSADPDYPLAQFNLGNLYDEQGRVSDAFAHYRRALQLNPGYADAHFNIALLCERTGDALKAVHHWKTYLKLDSTGQWAEIARRQLARLREAVIR